MIGFIKMKFGFYKRYLIHIVNHFKERYYLKNCRNRLKNKDFSIISNNCWGGSVCEDLGSSYFSPTIGLFFFSPCYIKFLEDLKDNLMEEMVFITKSKYERGNYLQTLNPYPIGLIKGEIEVHFLHYKTNVEAEEKWKRRCRRVNFNNLFLSFSDSEGCTYAQVKKFDSLPYRKVFFSAKKIEGIRSLVFLKSYHGQPGIGNIYDDRWKYRRHFDVVNWLNSKVEKHSNA